MSREPRGRGPCRALRAMSASVSWATMSTIGARYYDAMIGRWDTVDPLDGLYPEHSPYSYALNNPLSFADLTGLCPEGVGHGEVYENDAGEQVLCYNEGNDEGVVVEAERSKGSSAAPVGGFFSMLGHRFITDPFNLESGGRGHSRRATSYEYADGQYWRVVDSLLWVRPSADFMIMPGAIGGAIGNASASILKRLASDPNKIRHIMQSHHNWGKLFANPNWKKVSNVIGRALEEGTEFSYKGVSKKVYPTRGGTVEVIYTKLSDGTVRVSDAWVR